MILFNGTGDSSSLATIIPPIWIKIVGLLLSITATYFLTIQSIKVEMASKAEYATVEELNRKLSNIEVMLRQGVLDKETFYQFSAEIDKRLTTIETLLAEQKGR